MPSNIAEQNVQRLLEQAYEPESPDADFVGRVTAALDAEAASRRQRAGVLLPSGETLALRPWQVLLGWAVAISLLVGVVYVVNRPGPPHKPSFYRDGRVVWHNGTPYVMADVTTDQKTKANSAEPNAPINGRKLTARSRPAMRSAKPLSVGETLATARGRRRVTLPDGSVLHLNENTRVTIDGERSINVADGEVYLEVNPAHPKATDGRFWVKTPHRDLSALGTRFAVRVDDRDTGVVVVQGKVQASDVKSPLVGGQQLAGKTPRISAAPRASHVLDWMRDLIAASETSLVPPSRYAGGALVAVDPQGQEASLSLRKFHVDVHVEDGFARTTIDQTYFNHEAGFEEGTFFFPLPPDASLSRLAMYVGPNLMEGGMVERDYGRHVFETIKYRMLDPALLEWVDGSTFKMRVFPLEGRQEKRIVLSYTQRLPAAYGQTRYRFPAGHSMKVVDDWSLRVRVRHGADMAWHCGSHELAAERPDRDLVLTAAEKRVKPDRDVVLRFAERERGRGGDKERGRQGDTARFSMHEQDGWRYVMLRYRPRLEGQEQSQSQRQRRDWLFLVETSADRNPLLARTQIEILRSLLENAEDDDTFRVLAAGTRTTEFADEPLPITPENIAAAIQFLEDTHLVGALDLEEALAAAQPRLADAGNPVLVHLGSGVPVVGERDAGRLVRGLSDAAPYVGVGVGKRWNRPFMRQAAAHTSGHFTQINPDEPLAWRAFELLSTLNAPRLLDLKASGGSLRFLNLDDFLADGEELCTVARVPAGQRLPRSVTVRGRLHGEKFERKIPVRSVARGAGYLPRIWAKQEIGRLLAADAAKHRERIIALSKAMYVMSPFTSLLVLENEAMYKEFNVDRGRKDHWAQYPCPDKIKVVHEPLHGPLAQAPPPKKEPGKTKPGKPTVEQVLRTLLVRVPPSILKFRHDVDLSGTYRASQLLAPWDGFDWDIDDDIDKPFQIFGKDSVGLAMPGVFSADLTVGGEPDFESLISLILNTVRPDTWQELGGSGSIDLFEAKMSLVISQRGKIQNNVADPFFSSRISAWGNHRSDFVQDGRFNHIVMLVDDSRSMAVDDVGFFPVRNTRHFLGNPEIAGPWLNATTQRAITVRIPPSGTKPLGLRYQVEQRDSKIQRLQAELTERQRILDRNVREAQQRLGQLETTRSELQAAADRIRQENLQLARTLREAAQAQGERDRLQQRYRTLLAQLAEYRSVLQDRGLPLNLAKPSVVGRVRAVNNEHGLVEINMGTDDGLKHGDELSIYRVGDTLAKTRFVGRIRLTRTEKSASVGHLQFRYQEMTVLVDDHVATRFTDASAAEDRLVSNLAERLAAGASREALLYEQPTFSGNPAVFSDLLAYAPGMRTSGDDVRAVLEAEAQRPEGWRRGEIDPAARKLIDNAREAGWRTVTWKDDAGKAVLAVQCDGRGRFRYQRRTADGLNEQVVCDGATLWHLYPELGVAARRTMSRFHRAALASLVPWAVSPAKDYAIGANVRRVDGRTVAIIPLAAADSKDKDGKPLPHLQRRLIFAADGRLIERRVVLVPENKIMLRVTYAADGTVRHYDGDEKKPRLEFSLAVAASDPADLKPNLKSLVVLPMPQRTAEPNEKPQPHSKLSEQAALRLIAADLGWNNQRLLRVIGDRFFRRGDRRVGFYTLLLMTQRSWQLDETVQIGPGEGVRMDPLADHPNSPLARYIAWQVRFTRTGEPAGEVRLPRPDDGFLEQLAACRDWHARRPKGDDKIDVPSEWSPRFLEHCRSPRLAWAVFEHTVSLSPTYPPLEKDKLPKFYSRFDDGPLSYFGRYERARMSDDWKLFEQLFRETLSAGGLPRLDGGFFEAGGQQCGPLLQEAARSLVADGRYGQAILLAWQCALVDDEHGDVADAMFDIVLANTRDHDRLLATVAAIEYFCHREQYSRAQRLLDALLKDERIAPLPSIWRLAAVLADKQGRLAKQVEYAEQGLQRHYVDRGRPINLEQFRADYGQLLDLYQKLAASVSDLGPQTSAELAARVVRVADRWREIEPDPTDVCQRTAEILGLLGRDELAWDYLTTPLAGRPNEGATWADLAAGLKSQGQFALADRAYAAAFESEGSNPTHLWRRAQLLQQQGDFAAARRLYQQIAAGVWPPQFKAIHRDAKQIVGTGR